MRAIQLVLFLSFHSFFNACLVISNFQNDKCTPRDNTTYLLAYSNDIDPKRIAILFNNLNISSRVDRKFVKLARVRFDVRQPDEIEYYDNLNEFLSETNYSLPDPSLSYSSTSEGSDVISVLERFLENTQSPVCGSRINFLLKRLPTEVDVESIVAKLKKFHIEVYFAISGNTSGGNTLDSLNEIAFKTNGGSMFLSDDDIGLGVFNTQHYRTQTLIYAANFNVSGQGTIELPPMTVRYDDAFMFLMSYKDDILSDTFQTATLTCTNTITNEGLIYEYEEGEQRNFCFKGTTKALDKGIYTMKLEYKYANQDVERLFIRVRTISNTPPVDYWVPYDN